MKNDIKRTGSVPGIVRRFFVVLVLIVMMEGQSLTVAVNAEDKPDPTNNGWGTSIDPDKDCEFKSTREKLTITVPPMQHNLYPPITLNAPRVLRKVSGDFVIQVKVTSNLDPTRFFGAGILLWDSDDCFLRVERNAFINGETVNCYPPLIEYWKDKKYAGFNDAVLPAKYFVGESTWFRVERKDRSVAISISHDGVVWIDLKTVEVDMSLDLMVGVAAVSVSKTPFTAVFEELTIKETKPKGDAKPATSESKPTVAEPAPKPKRP